MTNHEKYQKAFSYIRPESDLVNRILEEKNMKENHRFLPRLAVVCTMLICLTIGGFAAVRTSTVQSWLYGRPADITIEEISEGHYLLTYPDGSQRETGGTAYVNGKPVDVSIEDIERRLQNEPELLETEDGRWMFYYRDSVIDVTEDLLDDSHAQIRIRKGILPLYFTLRLDQDGGYSVSMSSTGFSEP